MHCLPCVVAYLIGSPHGCASQPHVCMYLVHNAQSNSLPAAGSVSPLTTMTESAVYVAKDRAPLHLPPVYWTEDPRLTKSNSHKRACSVTHGAPRCTVDWSLAPQRHLPSGLQSGANLNSASHSSARGLPWLANLLYE